MNAGDQEKTAAVENAAANTTDKSTPDSGKLDRRGFMTRLMAGVVGSLVAIVPFLLGLLFFLDPLLRKKSTADDRGSGGVIKDENGFIKMHVTADALPADGSPQMFKIHDDVVDAWNKFLNVEIGSVWLRRDPKTKQVVALSSICPHLGCAVDYRKANSDLYCPCHKSAFDLDGGKLNDIPPRGMDTLALKPGTGNEIWIKYEKFRATIAEKKPIT